MKSCRCSGQSEQSACSTLSTPPSSLSAPPLNETWGYTLATERVCRNSCIVPAAIRKVMGVAAGIFLPGDCQIEFVEGAIQAHCEGAGGKPRDERTD